MTISAVMISKMLPRMDPLRIEIQFGVSFISGTFLLAYYTLLSRSSTSFNGISGCFDSSVGMQRRAADLFGSPSIIVLLL